MSSMQAELQAANALRGKAKEKRASLAPLQQQIEEAQGRLKELE